MLECTRRQGRLVRLRGACLLIAALLLNPATVPAQANARAEPLILQGRVLDARSRAAINRASIVTSRGSDTVAAGYTDSIGSFSLPIGGIGPVTVYVRRLGYRPMTLFAVESQPGVPLQLSMVPIPQDIEGVAVTARGASSARVVGFEDRLSRHIGGTFITREQLDSWHPMRTTDVMRRVSGVKLFDSVGVLLVISSRGFKVNLLRNEFMAPCVLRVGVDGFVKEWGFSVNQIDPNQIYGIEVYNGPATIPPEFNALRTDSYCGLVMIWTQFGH